MATGYEDPALVSQLSGRRPADSGQLYQQYAAEHPELTEQQSRGRFNIAWNAAHPQGGTSHTVYGGAYSPTVDIEAQKAFITKYGDPNLPENQERFSGSETSKSNQSQGQSEDNTPIFVQPKSTNDPWAEAMNAQPTLEAQRQYAERHDDPYARIAYYERYQKEETVSMESIGRGYQKRADFVSITSLGSNETAIRANRYMNEGRYPDPVSATLAVLEEQYQEARKTPGLTDDRFFMNEMQLAAQQGIGRSSQAHYEMGKGWAAYAGNPWEPAGDTYLEIIKGYPTKGAEGPLSFKTPLPEYMGARVGLQDIAWKQAIQGDRNQSIIGFEGTFKPAIDLAATRYGQIYQGIIGGSPNSQPLGNFRFIKDAYYKPGLSFADDGFIRVEPTALSGKGAETYRVQWEGMVAPSRDVELATTRTFKPSGSPGGSPLPGVTFGALPEGTGLPSVMRVGKPTPTSPEESLRVALLKETPATFGLAGTPMGLFASAYSVGQGLKDIPLFIGGFVSNKESGMVSGYEKSVAGYEANQSRINAEASRIQSDVDALNKRFGGGELSPEQFALATELKGGIDTKIAAFKTNQSALESEFNAVNLQRTSILTEQQRKSEIDPWGKINVGVAHSTTWAFMPELKGVDKSLENWAVDWNKGRSQKDILFASTEGAQTLGGIVEGGYGYFRNKPVDVMGTYAVGAVVFPALGYGAETLVARGAASKVPLFAKAGQLLSKPAAGTIVKFGMLGAYGTSEYLNIVSQPTPYLKGKAAGEAGGQFGVLMFGSMNAMQFKPVENLYRVEKLPGPGGTGRGVDNRILNADFTSQAGGLEPTRYTARPEQLETSRLLGAGREPFVQGGQTQTLGGNWPSFVGESSPVKTQMTTEQMRLLFGMQTGVISPEIPRAYSVSEPTEFLYQTTALNRYGMQRLDFVGGTENTIGYPRINRFVPKTVVQKMAESRRGTFDIFNVKPLYGVENSYNLVHNKGTSIDLIPGTTISRLKPEPSLGIEKKFGMERIPGTNIHRLRKFPTEKETGGGGGGGYYSDPNRGGIIVDTKTGRLVLVSKSRLSDSNWGMGGGIFQTGQEYELSQLASNVHLSPYQSRRFRMLESDEEQIYVGTIPGVERPRNPNLPAAYDDRTMLNELGIPSESGVSNARRQATALSIKPAFSIDEYLDVRAAETGIYGIDLTQTRITEKVQYNVPVNKQALARLNILDTIQTPGLMTFQEPDLGLRQFELTTPETVQITVPWEGEIQRPREPGFERPGEPGEPRFTRPTPPLGKPVWIPGGGGGTSGYPRFGGSYYRWAYTNPTADMPYLSKGMADPFGRKPKRKKRDNPFNF